MTNREFFIECWEQEHPTFIKVFTAVPADQLAYRPHPRSRSAAELVWLQVLEKQCWVELLETGKIHWRITPEKTSLDEMILLYDRAHADLASRLKRLDDETWTSKSTQFVFEGQVAIETTMGHMFWIGFFDAIHHRGQLTVYIRPMGGKVPAVYAPSADDPVMPLNPRGLSHL